MLGGRPSPSRRPGGPDLERHRFWRGQHLLARDLDDLVAGEEERLWWHNRAIHDAYGVVFGLAVTPAGGAEPGVVVGPGLAYDAYGRELGVFAPATAAMPRGAGAADEPATEERWALLLRFRDAGAGARGCGGGTGCGCGAAPRGELVWRRARRVGLEDGVVLARGRWISGTAGWLFVADEGFDPLRARAVARPRLGRGETPRGGTAWRLWSQPPDPPLVDPAGATLPGLVVPAAARGIEVEIDTAAAGFTRTPCYFAWLQGGPWQVAHRLATTLPLGRITAAGRDRFTFSLWDPAASTGSPTTTDATGNALPLSIQSGFLTLASQRLHVCWLGIQHDPSSFDAEPAAAAPRRLEPR